jgi:hypothetical protein
MDPQHCLQDNTRQDFANFVSTTFLLESFVFLPPLEFLFLPSPDRLLFSPPEILGLLHQVLIHGPLYFCFS